MEVHFMTEGEAQEMEKKTFTWRERDKSGMSRADFIRCGARFYLEKVNPKNITSIGLRYKTGLKKVSEGNEILKSCRSDMEKIGLSKEQIDEHEEKWSVENGSN